MLFLALAGMWPHGPFEDVDVFFGPLGEVVD